MQHQSYNQTLALKQPEVIKQGEAKKLTTFRLVKKNLALFEHVLILANNEQNCQL